MYHEDVRLKVPNKAEDIMNKLSEYGHSSYIVGGCVRDSLLGIEPKDWDIATSMHPDDIMYTFNSLGYVVIPTGIKHGTVTIIVEGEHFEVTTYRKDGEYSDGRRPDEVEYATTIEEDLSRRDFTVNAMAYNELVGLVDPFDGIGDLLTYTIRAVGNPSQRFEEDGLRMLRAIRFAATHGMEIDPTTYKAIYKNSKLLKDISVERKREELYKILLSENAEYGIYHLQNTSLMDHIIPELSGERFDMMDDIPCFYGLRLAYMLLDYHENHVRAILNSLKMDNETKRLIINGINAYDQIDELEFPVSRSYMKKLIREYGCKELYGALLIAQVMSGEEELYTTMISIQRDIMTKNKLGKEPIWIKDLAVDGRDLIEIGIVGKEIGEALNRMIEYVTVFPENNNKETLLIMGHYN